MRLVLIIVLIVPKFSLAFAMQSASFIIFALTMVVSQVSAIFEAKENTPQLRGVEPEMNIWRSLQIGDNSTPECRRCK